MSDFLLKPTGNLAAVEPRQVIVTPIAAAAVAVGDIVMFDISGTNATYTDTTKFDELDNKKCPFNVVVLGTAGLDAGIFGVVTEAAVAGARCKVCVHGVVNAKISGTTSIGATPMTVGAGVLVPAASGVGTAVAIALATNASGAATIRVLFNGYSIGSQAA